jgi:hypothetical protein
MPGVNVIYYLRQFSRENPPGVVVVIGVALAALGFIGSYKQFSFILLYSGIIMLVMGIGSEIVWVILKRRNRRAGRSP